MGRKEPKYFCTAQTPKFQQNVSNLFAISKMIFQECRLSLNSDMFFSINCLMKLCRNFTNVFRNWQKIKMEKNMEICRMCWQICKILWNFRNRVKVIHYNVQFIFSIHSLPERPILEAQRVHRSELACTDARRMATQSPPDAPLQGFVGPGTPIRPWKSVDSLELFRFISLTQCRYPSKFQNWISQKFQNSA